MRSSRRSISSEAITRARNSISMLVMGNAAVITATMASATQRCSGLRKYVMCGSSWKSSHTDRVGMNTGCRAMERKREKARIRK